MKATTTSEGDCIGQRNLVVDLVTTLLNWLSQEGSVYSVQVRGTYSVQAKHSVYCYDSLSASLSYETNDYGAEAVQPRRREEWRDQG